MSYRIDRPHDPAEDVSIAYDDPELAIRRRFRWPQCRSGTGGPSLAAAMKALA